MIGHVKRSCQNVQALKENVCSRVPVTDLVLVERHARVEVLREPRVAVVSGHQGPELRHHLGSGPQGSAVALETCADLRVARSAVVADGKVLGLLEGKRCKYRVGGKSLYRKKWRPLLSQS